MYRKVTPAWKNRNKAQDLGLRTLLVGREPAGRCGLSAAGVQRSGAGPLRRKKGFGAPVGNSRVTTERFGKAGATQSPAGARPAPTRRSGDSNPRTALASQLRSRTVSHRRPETALSAHAPVSVTDPAPLWDCSTSRRGGERPPAVRGSKDGPRPLRAVRSVAAAHSPPRRRGAVVRAAGAGPLPR